MGPKEFKDMMDYLTRPRMADGGRAGFQKGTTPKVELERIQNPIDEALKEISEIIDKYTKTSVINGQPIKHLSKEGPVDKIFKEIKTKGYKKPSISKPLFARVLAEKGVTTYDNYRTNKIVFTLQDVLRKNKGDVLSIKPSAIAEILPEFAIKGSKGGEGLPAFRTFLNYLEGSQRLSDRAGLQVPTTIAGKPVSQIVDQLKQNFLNVPGGRARGDFRVFNETKLLDKLANENPEVTAMDLKKIYEKNGGTSFKERLKNLYIAKSGQETKKTIGGKSILEGVKTGEISNKLPKSLKKSFAIYGKDFNFGRFSRFAAEETDPVKIRYYNDLANKFFTTGAQAKYGTQGLVAEHGLPISAYDRGYADISTRVKIDGYVTPEINDWKARNFDFPIFRPGGLADQYSNASMADKPKIKKQIENKLKITKLRTPNLVKNIKFDFTNGIFTASSSTPEISEKNISNLIKQGQQTKSVFNKTAGLTTADKAPIPEKTKTRNMFKDFEKRTKLPTTDGPTLGMNLGLFKGFGEALRAVPTPLGTVGATAGFGVDPTSAIDRATLATEAALAPQLVKQSARFGPVAQRIFNLGLNPATALRVARFASPIGIASLGLEGLYNVGKLGLEDQRRFEALSPEEQRAERAGQEEFARGIEGAREGGIIGKKSGPPPTSGFTPHGLPGLLKRGTRT